MLRNRQADVIETIFRFFSFFTILTNILVALFFTVSAFNLKRKPFNVLIAKGSLTAITAFILIVGIVYQVALRNVWNPTGLQRIVDELLLTIIPLLMLAYWLFFFRKSDLQIAPLLLWLLYPVIYVCFIFIRGHFTGYYPYPFFDVTQIGIGKAMVNIGVILGTIFVVYVILLFFGKWLKKHNKNYQL